MRILLVDDHEIVRRGLRQLLAEAYPQADFGEAGRVPAARAAMTLEMWQLVVLDINLPDGSGLELLAQSRQLLPTTPVLVLSAYPEAEFAVRAFKLGAAGYLTKTSVADEMLLAVRRVLAGSKYVSAALAEHLASALGSVATAAPHEALSARELEVLRQVALGHTIREIAAALLLSEKTVATYRSRISEKLGLSTNVELARYALQHELVN
jgi:DNA-binding NarL/FixJ family response regulator